METLKNIRDHKLNHYNDLVKNPGKFQGENPYVPYMWEESLAGLTSESWTIHCDSGEYLDKIEVQDIDRQLFPELVDREYVFIFENSDGFTYEMDDKAALEYILECQKCQEMENE